MLTSFNHLIPSQYWKFFTDVEYWGENDPEIFDKQKSPGYFRHCSIALWWMLQTLHQPVDLDYIIALRNVVYHTDANASRGLALKASSGLGEGSLSKAGFEQLVRESQSLTSILGLEQKIVGSETSHVTLLHTMSDLDIKNHLSSLEKMPDYYTRLGLARISNDINEVILTINTLLDHYQQAIKKATSDNRSLSKLASVIEVGEGSKQRTKVYTQVHEDSSTEPTNNFSAEVELRKKSNKKLTAIVRLIQGLHQFHLFSDGNGRTFCFFLLNRLLLENDLAPTIINAPGNFTGWSVEELVTEVEKGQERFRSLCTPLEISLVDTIATRINLTEEEKKQVIASYQQRDLNEQLFYQALADQNKQQQFAILKNLPQYERILLVKKQCKYTDIQEPAEDLLEKLRWLQYCGFDNDDSLLDACLKCDSTERLKGFLTVLHKSPLAKDPAWKELVSDMILHGNDDAPQALEKAIAMAITLKDKPWFDIQQYIEMLKHSSPAYTTFSDIENNKIIFSESSCAFIKTYLYKFPEAAHKLLETIYAHQHAAPTSERTLTVEPYSTAYSDNIFLFISDDNHVKYGTKFSNEISEVDLEGLLDEKISPEALKQLKNAISIEPEIKRNLDLQQLRSKTSCKKPPKQESFEDRIKTIDKNLPSLLRNLADEHDGHPRKQKLEERERQLHQECKQIIAPAPEKNFSTSFTVFQPREESSQNQYLTPPSPSDSL